MKALRRGRAKSNASETSITIPGHGGSQSNLEGGSIAPDLGGSGSSLATGSTSLGGSKSNMLGPDVNVKRDERGDGANDQPWKSIVRKTTIVSRAARRYFFFINASDCSDQKNIIWSKLRVETRYICGTLILFFVNTCNCSKQQARKARRCDSYLQFETIND